MNKRLAFAFLVSMIAVGTAHAGLQTPKFGLSLGDIDPIVAKPAPKQCPPDGDKGNKKCVQDFIKACGDGTTEASGESGGNVNMFCK